MQVKVWPLKSESYISINLLLNYNELLELDGCSRGATKTSCVDGFLFGPLRKTVSIDCGDFSFLCQFPSLEKAQQLLLHNLHAWGFSDLTTTGGKIRCQRHLYSALCTLVFQIRHVRAFLVLS